MAEEQRPSGEKAQDIAGTAAADAKPVPVSASPGGPDAAGGGPAGRPAGGEPMRVFHGTGGYVTVAVGFLLAAALVILMAQNTKEATLDWVAWSITVPIGVIVLTAAFGGSLLTVVWGLVWRRRRRRILSEREELRRLRAERAAAGQPGAAAARQASAVGQGATPDARQGPR